MINWLTAFCAIINYKIVISVVGPQHSPFESLKEWNLIKYNFEFNAPTQDTDFYNPQNILQTGLAVGYDRIFIATPRLFSGVPATISEISRTNVNKSPDYKAYPDWSYHTAALRKYNCSDLGLVSVYRLRIDSCNRLWALDAGVSRSLEDYEVTCPPKILVFDLNTNQVVRRIDFPREVYRGESLFTNLIIDETTSKSGSGCDDVFVYISDTVEPAIVVYDSARDLTWRVTHPAMYPDPDFAQSQIGDYKFVLMDGIVGLTFDDRAGIIYFQPLATDRLFSVTKQTLRAGPLPINQVLPVRLVGKKSSQGIGLAVSPFDSSVIFSPLTETAIASWNPSTNDQTILASDFEALQFVADITLSAHDPGAIYLVSSRFHRFFLKNLNTNEINNRIIRIELPGSRPAFHFNQPISYNPIYTGNEQYQIYPQQNGIEKRHPQASIHYLGNNEYFTGIKQPYEYQTVGLINRGLTNPFTGLNQGEEFPRTGLTTISKIPSYQQNLLSKRILPVPSYQNYFRFKKSISSNETRVY